MSNTIFYTKKGDIRTALKATLKNSFGEAVDLTGCNVRFIMLKIGNVTPKISRDAIIKDAVNGIVWFVFEANEVDEVGTYRAEFEVTYADGRIETFPNSDYITVVISSDLD